MELSRPLQGVESTFSVFGASRALNQLPDRVRLIASKLGIEPVRIVDGREYFDAADIERVKQVLENTPADLARQLR